MADRFNIGDFVENTARGIAPRQVWGVRKSPDGAFVQFSADGEWLAADGFALVGVPAAAPAPTTAAAASPEPDIGFEE